MICYAAECQIGNMGIIRTAAADEMLRRGVPDRGYMGIISTATAGEMFRRGVPDRLHGHN